MTKCARRYNVRLTRSGEDDVRFGASGAFDDLTLFLKVNRPYTLLSIRVLSSKLEYTIHLARKK